MHKTTYACLMLGGLLLAPLAWGQSTISNQPLEISTSKGPWIALLPAYELGVNANGGSAYRDNLDDVGYLGQLKIVRRFLGTRTSFEAKGFYGYLESLNRTDAINIGFTNPATGGLVTGLGSPTRLRTKTDFYGFDIALRDTWRTQFGGLSAGVAFSYMGLDQKFDLDYGAIQVFREKLDADFVGGKAIFGWDGCCHGRPTMIDLGFGFYDMDSDYRFLEQTIPGSLDRELSKTAYTVEASITRWHHIRGFQVGASLGTLYISHLPTIEHDDGVITTLDTDDGVMFNAMLECLL